MTMPCTPPVQGSKRLVFEQLRHRDGEREGRQREIEPFEPQRRQAEQEADGEADRAGDRQRRSNRATSVRVIRIAVV